MLYIELHVVLTILETNMPDTTPEKSFEPSPTKVRDTEFQAKVREIWESLKTNESVGNSKFDELVAEIGEDNAQEILDEVMRMVAIEKNLSISQVLSKTLMSLITNPELFDEIGSRRNKG